MKKLLLMSILLISCEKKGIPTQPVAATLNPKKNDSSNPNINSVHILPYRPFVNVDMGRGVNSFIGITEEYENSVPCISKGPISSSGDSTGAKTTISVSRVTDNADLSQQLENNIGVTLGVKIPSDIIDIVSGNVKVNNKSIQEEKIHSDHSYALIKIERLFSPLNMQTFEVWSGT